MGELWLAFLLKCVPAKWLRRLFITSLIVRVFLILCIIAILYEYSVVTSHG
jgi:hypothetical protein